MSRVYIIAELGINHQGSFETACKLIEAAKEAGCDAVKLQKRDIPSCYTQEELSQPRESVFGTTNGDLKRGLEFARTEYDECARLLRTVGLDWSASCWDAASVAFIAGYAPPWLKIPSARITNVALLQAYRETGIPLIMSTGMSTWEEIDAAVEILSDSELTLLQCHAAYPSPLEEINLACLQSFKARYPGVRVGYSSHTVSPWPCLMAACAGAEVIEAHLTLSRAQWGSDHAASLEPAAFKKMVTEIRTWEICKGDGIKRIYDSELPVKAKLRR